MSVTISHPHLVVHKYDDRPAAVRRVRAGENDQLVGKGRPVENEYLFEGARSPDRPGTGNLGERSPQQQPFSGRYW